MNLSTLHSFLLLRASLLICCLLGISTLTLSTGSVAESFSASVNRSSIELNESFELTLSIDQQVFIGEPDLEEIKKNFRVIGKRRSSQYRSVNGDTLSVTDWVVSLKPKKTGYLVIPPISFKGMESQAIAVEVSKARKTKATQDSQVFFETDVDRSNVYIQAQLLYNVRLFTAVGISRANITEPKSPQAIIHSLGNQLMYETVRNGVRYQVHEWNYAILPQHAGTLVIPAPVLTATLSSRSSMYGRPISITTEDLSVEVKPIPDSYPAIPWIATPSLEVFEQWDPAESTVKVGDSITRTIEFHIDNNEAALIAGFEHGNTDGLKIYPDQPQTEDHETSKGIQGTRVDKIAYVATKAGNITLPALEISWWNTQTEQLQTTRLPKRTFKVLTAVSATPSDDAIDKNAFVAPPNVPAESAATGSAIGAGLNEKANYWWILSSAILSLLLVLLCALWWRTRQQLKAIQHRLDSNGTIPQGRTNEGPFDEQLAFKQLQQACDNQSPTEIWNALIHWGVQYWRTDEVRSSEQIIRRLAGDSALPNIIRKLDRAIFSDASATFSEGAQLVEAVSSQRKIKLTTDASSGESLKPLYPI